MTFWFFFSLTALSGLSLFVDEWQNNDRLRAFFIKEWKAFVYSSFFHKCAFALTVALAIDHYNEVLPVISLTSYVWSSWFVSRILNPELGDDATQDMYSSYTPSLPDPLSNNPHPHHWS